MMQRSLTSGWGLGGAGGGSGGGAGHLQQHEGLHPLYDQQQHRRGGLHLHNRGARPPRKPHSCPGLYANHLFYAHSSVSFFFCTPIFSPLFPSSSFKTLVPTLFFPFSCLFFYFFFSFLFPFFYVFLRQRCPFLVLPCCSDLLLSSFVSFTYSIVVIHSFMPPVVPSFLWDCSARSVMSCRLSIGEESSAEAKTWRERNGEEGQVGSRWGRGKGESRTGGRGRDGGKTKA